MRFLGLMKFVGPAKLVSKCLTVTLVLGSAMAVAQTRETLHQQAPNRDEAITHAEGKPVDTSKSFTERYAPPEDISTLGYRIDWLFKYTSWVTFGFFVIMVGALLYFMIAFRQRPGHQAYYTHGTTKSNRKVALLLDAAVFITLDLVLIVASYIDTRDIIWAYPTGDDVVKVQVLPQQWVWNFKYAGTDGRFGTDDDIYTINEIRLPKGKKVLFQIKSKDVIHGFFLPNIRMQVDAIPGVVTKIWMQPTKTGDFEVACYHHCGTSHYKMKAWMKVLEPVEYDEWVAEHSEWAKAKLDKDDKFTQWGWSWGPDGDITPVSKTQ